MNTPKANQEKLPLDNKSSEIKDTLKMNSSKLKILAATVLISLSLSQALNAQETKPINDPEHPVFNMESFSNCKNLTFVIDNVEKYFPGMEEDVKDMLATITTQERREAVDSILAQTVMILSDEKQKIGTAVYAISAFVAYDKRFGQKYPKFITPETFKLAYNFNKEYDKWYDGELERLENLLAETNADINTMIQNIEKMISTFSPEQAKKDPKLKNIILQTQAHYIKRNKTIPAHLQELIDAIQ